VAIGLAYLWLWRARKHAATWGEVFTDPLVLVGTLAALALGALFGFWRARYEWKEKEERVQRAREYAGRVQEQATSGFSNRPRESQRPN